MILNYVNVLKYLYYTSLFNERKEWKKCLNYGMINRQTAAKAEAFTIYDMDANTADLKKIPILNFPVIRKVLKYII